MAFTVNKLPSDSNNSNIPTTEFTPTQFHIQTDDGANRFFKYQTWSGQFRKETRLDDGSVAGSYGWVDANGMLRIYEYRADKAGYRITNSAMYNVGQQDEKTLSKTDSLRKRKKANKDFNRKKSPFFRTSQQRKKSQLLKQQERESEISNDIFGDEDISDGLPTKITSPLPVVVSLKRRRTTQRVRKFGRPSPLPFMKRRTTKLSNNFRNEGISNLETEQNQITGESRISRLQRRISTPDGRIKMVNVEPLFDDDDLFSRDDAVEQKKTKDDIDNGDDILFLPSRRKPNGRVILNTPHRRRTKFNALTVDKSKRRNVGNRLRFNSNRRRQERKLRKRPLNISGGGPFVIKRRRRPITSGGRIPMTRQNDSVLKSTNDNADDGILSVNYATSNTFHHENTLEDGQRKGQYGYIDPIGVRRVVTYTTGSRASSAKGKPKGITKIKENDFYGTNTYFKAN
jgi:hypothetical protein